MNRIYRGKRPIFRLRHPPKITARFPPPASRAKAPRDIHQAPRHPTRRTTSPRKTENPPSHGTISRRAIERRIFITLAQVPPPDPTRS